MSLNVVCLTGRLTRDPELRTTATGKQVVNFTIAVQKRFKPQNPDEPDANFFNCVAWGDSAEFLTNYGSKGRLVGVSGRLEQRKYQASDGTMREVIEVVVDNVQMLDRPRDDVASDTVREAAVVSASEAKVEPEEEDPFAEE